MKHFRSLREALETMNCLSSELRVEILELLQKHKTLNIDSLAKNLHITNGALTPHIKKLARAGLIKISTLPGIHGEQKQCSLAVNKIMVDFNEIESQGDGLQVELDYGQYCGYEVHPVCGIANGKNFVGEVNNPLYFDYPDRFSASMLWLGHGFLEYRIPNLLGADEKALQFSLSMELAGFEGSAEVSVQINGKTTFVLNCEGAFSDRSGLFSPIWWPPNLGQYGALKTLTVNENGSFVNDVQCGGQKISDINIENGQSILIRINVKRGGGVIFFGKGFGDYDIGLKTVLIASKVFANNRR